MTDAEFLAALESGTMDPAAFGHAAHLRLGYLCLRGEDFIVGLGRLATILRGFIARLGQSDKYHHTMTVAYAALIHRHLIERGDPGSWPAFEAQNPELLGRGLLLEYFEQSQLDSDLARRTLLLPRAAGRSGPGEAG